MARYVLRRLLAAIPTLFVVIAVAFLLVRLTPGGPFDREREVAPEVEAALIAAYDLDDPLIVQFVDYVGGLLKGDFGPSFRFADRDVGELIAGALPFSVAVGLPAMLLALLIGVAAGSWAALKQNSLVDRTVMALAMTGISIPIFVIAPLLVLAFALKLDWFPASWSASGGFAWLVLPVLALALPQIAYIARLTRASMIEVLATAYVRTARAQGLSTPEVVRYHALRPAMLPVLSYLGPAIAAVLTGSIVIEQVFNIPGLGRLFITGALGRDYTLVLGIVTFYAALVMALNLIVDVLYGLLDPRIRQR